MNLWAKILGTTLLLACLISSCSDSFDQETFDIYFYAENKRIEVVDTNEVFVFIKDAGTVDRPKEKSLIHFKYKSSYLDDEIINISEEKIKMPLLIPGLRRGLSLLGKNGKATIIIPSDLGFGKNPPFGMRKNATLVYEVELIDF